MGPSTIYSPTTNGDNYYYDPWGRRRTNDPDAAHRNPLAPDPLAYTCLDKWRLYMWAWWCTQASDSPPLPRRLQGVCLFVQVGFQDILESVKSGRFSNIERHVIVKFHCCIGRRLLSTLLGVGIWNTKLILTHWLQWPSWWVHFQKIANVFRG